MGNEGVSEEEKHLFCAVDTIMVVNLETVLIGIWGEAAKNSVGAHVVCGPDVFHLWIGL